MSANGIETSAGLSKYQQELDERKSELEDQLKTERSAYEQIRDKAAIAAKEVANATTRAVNTNVTSSVETRERKGNVTSTENAQQGKTTVLLTDEGKIESAKLLRAQEAEMADRVVTLEKTLADVRKELAEVEDKLKRAEGRELLETDVQAGITSKDFVVALQKIENADSKYITPELRKALIDRVMDAAKREADGEIQKIIAGLETTHKNLTTVEAMLQSSDAVIAQKIAEKRKQIEDAINTIYERYKTKMLNRNTVPNDTDFPNLIAREKAQAELEVEAQGNITRDKTNAKDAAILIFKRDKTIVTGNVSTNGVGVVLAELGFNWKQGDLVRGYLDTLFKELVAIRDQYNENRKVTDLDDLLAQSQQNLPDISQSIITDVKKRIDSLEQDGIDGRNLKIMKALTYTGMMIGGVLTLHQLGVLGLMLGDGRNRNLSAGLVAGVVGVGVFKMLPELLKSRVAQRDRADKRRSQENAIMEELINMQAENQANILSKDEVKNIFGLGVNNGARMSGLMDQLANSQRAPFGRI